MSRDALACLELGTVLHMLRNGRIRKGRIYSAKAVLTFPMFTITVKRMSPKEPWQ